MTSFTNCERVRRHIDGFLENSGDHSGSVDYHYERRAKAELDEWPRVTAEERF